MIGCYLLSTRRPRYGYLITRIDDRGRRGGLGEAVHSLLVLTVEHVPVTEARESGRWYGIVWDSRGRVR